MSEHIIQWLGAYHDGELSGLRLRQVEQHLAECAECRAELDGLQGLAELLQGTAPAGDFLPTERFVANLTLNLPRQPEPPQPHRILEIGWWLIPVGLLGAWVFVQVTFALSTLALAAADTGLLGSNLAWLPGNAPQMEWFTTVMNLFGNQIGLTGQFALAELNEANLFVAQLLGRLLPQAVLAVLYLGWLGAWWLRHQRQAAQNPGNFSQS
jgi:predicted anti-sigma-YlaC factor YlaD